MNELRRTIEVIGRVDPAEVACEQISYATAQVGNQATAQDERSIPSFFVVGPPRTGSSWLYEILRPYTSLPSPSKETRFFDTHFHRGMKWYLAHYGQPGESQRVGEVAPTYFASAAARERIALTAPQAKIVCVFRHPVDRIVSLYRVKRAYGWIPWSLAEALERDPELMESSRYASTLKRWQRSFGLENVLATIYDDLREDPQAFVDSIVDFIGVSRFPLADWHYGFVHASERMSQPRSYHRTRTATMLANWCKARRMDRVVSAFKNSPLRKLVLGGGAPFPKLSEQLLIQLHQKLEPEIEELEDMLHRDLSAWRLWKPVLSTSDKVYLP
ncbi:MAG: sulfotransferase [Candidatus Sulfotelmatobacter sp.]